MPRKKLNCGPTFAQSAWVTQRCRRDNQQSAETTRQMCETILTDASFDGAALGLLAFRRYYTIAAERLTHEALPSGGSLVPLLLANFSEVIAPRRIAQCFGVIAQTRESLQERRQDNEAAEAALAALGEIDWPNACRRARAAYALRILVNLMRWRA